MERLHRCFGELFVCLLTTAIATGGDLPELIAAQTTTPAGSRTLLPDDAANPLPVEFLFFTANYNNGGVLLEWATATEETNSHFEVERSIDAVNFEMINLVQGAGDSKARIDYSYSDQETRGLQATNLYYRLKQVDYDGEFEYSKTVIARNEDFTQQKLVVYPNPFEESVTLTLDAPNEEDVIISVFSADGRIAYSETKLVVQGRNDLGFDRLEQLPPGVYNLTVRGPSLYHNERLIKRN